MDAITAAHPEGWFDMIFADPPYFLSNGGITCHAGKMVKVNKGDWKYGGSAKIMSNHPSGCAAVMASMTSRQFPR